MATPPFMTFGLLLKRYRRAAGLTQDQLAARAGYSAVYISMIERNARPPLPATIGALAEALALDPSACATLLATIQRPLDQASPPPLEAVRSLFPFVGRQRELIQLGRHLAEEGPPLLLLAGEPGIGKTRLLQETGQRARNRGWAVLEGKCHRRSSREPYAPLRDALRHHVRHQTPAQLRAEPEGCAWLARLLPELAERTALPLPRWNLPPEQERQLIFAAVGRYLANVAGPMGTLLVLDDLQWAEMDALDLLAFLVRSAAAELPVRVVGAYRSTEVREQDALAILQGDLRHDDLAACLDLGLLSPREATELWESLLAGCDEAGDVALGEQVLQQAHGVPYFLVSYAQGLRSGTLRQGGTSADTPPAPWMIPRGEPLEPLMPAVPAALPVPVDVAESIRQRVAVLPEAARALLGVAAVVGRQAPWGVLCAAAGTLGQTDHEVLTALEVACHAGLLAEAGVEGDTYQFTHDLVREVVEGSLSGARRALLHLQVGEALEQQAVAPPPEPLAYHYERASKPEQAVIFLEQAGDHALSVHAHAAAESCYRELVDRLKELGREMDATRARKKLGLVRRAGAAPERA